MTMGAATTNNAVSLTTAEARALIENVTPADPDTYWAAWQLLVDTGEIWLMSPRLVREANRYLDHGLLRQAPNRNAYVESWRADAGETV